jgi:hypothetical protein
MKLRQSVFSIVFALLPLGGIAGHSLSRQSRSVSETPQHQLSKKELKTLVANARTAKDHQNLAPTSNNKLRFLTRKAANTKPHVCSSRNIL